MRTAHAGTDRGGRGRRPAARRHRPVAARTRGVQVQERRRAGQRQRDGHRSLRPLRRRASRRTTSSSTTTRRAGGHALQRRARAGEPRHRARHQRQHGRREDGVGASRRSIASCSSCSAPEDDVFLFRFGASPDLVHDWTAEKQLVSRRLNRISPAGGTAMYDAVAEAVPMAQGGEHRKKAILIVSDGNDTNSRTRRRRGEADDPRDRSAGLRRGHRRPERDRPSDGRARRRR